MFADKKSIEQSIKVLRTVCLEEEDTLMIVTPTISAKKDELILEDSGSIGRFVGDELLGKGGMKRIELVEDDKMKRTVAKASVHEDKLTQENIDLFIREARLTAALEHPHIVPIHDIGSHEGKPFFIMKNLDGLNLGQIIKLLSMENEEAVKAFSGDVLIKFFRDVCETISFAHKRGVLHLDIKPDNIHITEEGQLYVVDWGLSKIVGERCDSKSRLDELSDKNIDTTISDNIQGTPGYMAIEQVNSKVSKLSPRTDIYGLGATLYAILTLEHPNTEKDIYKSLKKLVMGDLIPPSERRPDFKINKKLEKITLKAMSKLPDDRYQNVDDLIKEIDAYLNRKKIFRLKIIVFILVALAAATYFTYPFDFNRSNSSGQWEGAVPRKADELNDALKLLNPNYKLNGVINVNDKGLIDNVDLGELRVTNISPLKGLPLKELRIKKTGVSDIQFLEGQQLKYFSLGETFVGDISVLEGQPIEKLYIYSTAIRDISSLRGMPLRVLWMGELDVSDISPLEGAPLEELWIGKTKVSDISVLKGMPLKQLWMEGTEVKDISDLRGLKLEFLDLRNTNVTDLTPIKDMPLKTLVIPAIRELEPGWEDLILNIKTLRRISTFSIEGRHKGSTVENFFSKFIKTKKVQRQ